jgi:hypothetical protein
MSANIKWFIFFFAMFTFCSLLSGIIEQQYLGGDYSKGSWVKLIDTWQSSSGADIGKVFALMVSPDLYGAIFNSMTWNYAFLDGGYIIIRLIAIMTLTTGFVVSFVLLIMSIVPIPGIGRGG